MITFKPIELSDKAWIDPLVFSEGSLSADFNFGNIYMWDCSYKQLVSRVGDRVVTKPKYGRHPFFACPIGSGDFAVVTGELEAYAAEHGFPFTLRGITDKYKALLEELFPGRFVFEPDRDHFDYVYSAERLATLEGKKLHNKRNHINKFISENDWEFRELTAGGIPECRAMLEQWSAQNGEDPALGLAAEHCAIDRAFVHFEELGLLGGMLYAGGRLVAFTIGERMCRSGFDVHFEKAFADVAGAYTMINREFVRLIVEKHPDVEWINREDDMGHEGLRQAKLSYYPDLLVEKYSAVLAD